MKSFTTWSKEISEVTETTEYQNATIVITDPSALTKTYSYDTNDYTVTGDAAIYTGAARVKPVTSGRNVDQAYVEDPTAVKTIRIQIPASELPTTQIRRGFQVQVTDGGDNPTLLTYLFTVMADVDGSSMASRTFEAVTNVEVNPEWA